MSDIERRVLHANPFAVLRRFLIPSLSLGQASRPERTGSGDSALSRKARKKRDAKRKNHKQARRRNRR